MAWIETDTLSNQNISSALAIGAYTATFDGFIVADFSADQVAGDGDYVAYITRQINGAGSAYVVLPKTTMTAAAGETAIAGQSGIISVRSGDVLTCYLDGLASDTTTPDTILRWYSVGVRVDAIDSDVITAAAIATGAIDADALATDAVNEIADQVWDELIAGHLGAGSTGAKLNTLANATDPLENTVPGSYVSGSAGYAIGRIGTGEITVLSPVTMDGDVTTYQGADYSVALGNPLVWTDSEDSWPSALGATDVITARVGGIEIDCELITGGTHLQIRCVPTRTETALIAARKHIFQVIGVQADGDVYSPIIEGVWTSKEIETGTAVPVT